VHSYEATTRLIRNSAAIAVCNFHVDRPVLLLLSSSRSRAIHDNQESYAPPHRPILRGPNYKNELAAFPTSATDWVELANSSYDKHMRNFSFISAHSNETFSFYGFLSQATD